jgi:hypothetical protein
MRKFRIFVGIVGIVMSTTLVLVGRGAPAAWFVGGTVLAEVAMIAAFGPWLVGWFFVLVFEFPEWRKVGLRAWLRAEREEWKATEAFLVGDVPLVCENGHEVPAKRAPVTSRRERRQIVRAEIERTLRDRAAFRKIVAGLEAQERSS